MNYFEDVSTDNFKNYTGSGFANIIISNDSLSNQIVISENGNSIVGRVKSNEVLDLKDANIDSIQIKSYVSGSPANFRIWFYGAQKIIYPEEQLKIATSNKQVPIPNRWAKTKGFEI